MSSHFLRECAITPLLLAALLLLLIVPTVCQQVEGHDRGVVWERIGQEMISHAPVIALTMDPADPNTIYAGAYHNPGLYKTTDGGSSWNPADVGLEGLAVFALQVDPKDSQTIYAGATNGLYRTTDGGASWHALSDELPYATVYAIAMDHDGNLYLGTDGHGLYRSDDGGQTVVPLGDELAETSILALVLDPEARTIFAGTSGQGLYVSHDAGQSWKPVPDLEGAYVSDMALHQYDSDLVFACTRRALWKTDNGGLSWEVADGGLEQRVNTVTFHPSHSEAVYAGTATGHIYRSTDGSGSWQSLSEVRRAVYSLIVDPANPALMYAGSWDGVYKSLDGGLSWELANRGLGSVEIEALVLDETNPQILYAGNTADAVYKSTDGGRSWRNTSRGLGETDKGRGVLSLAIAPPHHRSVYAGTNGRGVFVSTDGGESWAPAGPVQQMGMGAIVVHPQDEKHLWVRVFFDRVYESTDGGVSWQPRWEGMSPELEVISLIMDPHRPAVLYAGSEDGLYKSTDGRASWRKAGLEGQTVFSIAFDPYDPEVLYAGVTDGLYRSHNASVSWEPWGEELEETTISALVVDPTDGRIIYAGTKYHGFFWSGDGGRTWLAANTGLDSSSVDVLAVHPTGRLLYAATPDGVFRGVIQ